MLLEGVHVAHPHVCFRVGVMLAGTFLMPFRNGNLIDDACTRCLVSVPSIDMIWSQSTTPFGTSRHESCRPPISSLPPHDVYVHVPYSPVGVGGSVCMTAQIH